MVNKNEAKIEEKRKKKNSFEKDSATVETSGYFLNFMFTEDTS